MGKNRHDNNSSHGTTRLGVAVHVSITGPSILTNALELMMMTLITKPRKPWLLIIVRTMHAVMCKEARSWSTQRKVPFTHTNSVRVQFCWADLLHQQQQLQVSQRKHNFSSNWVDVSSWTFLFDPRGNRENVSHLNKNPFISILPH